LRIVAAGDFSRAQRLHLGSKACEELICQQFTGISGKKSFPRSIMRSSLHRAGESMHELSQLDILSRFSRQNVTFFITSPR
jgi:hypothetical protein